jgi:hypothetical protein
VKTVVKKLCKKCGVTKLETLFYTYKTRKGVTKRYACIDCCKKDYKQRYCNVEMNKCIKCGKKIIPSWKICDQCDKKVIS